MATLNIYQVKLQKVGTMECDFGLKVTDPFPLVKLLYQYLEGLDREHFAVIMLNSKLNIIGINTVHIGTLSACSVHPREIFKPAIIANVSAIAVGHNHPSGECLPSRGDIEVTEMLVYASMQLGIDLVDHVIVGNEETRSQEAYFSFKERGWLPLE